ncbi:hypothetical protein KUCAC02_029192 [Chaenocephalus aceratus]|uniref:Uncharacterized protein n=2 Tax=Chaenocephalus aceratus TaxID=36190 RepID=A0ACB9X418_CHAAC|nr:hypothetical protein KUCAC02_029192 [Chaenocephalus aceratus]
MEFEMKCNMSQMWSSDVQSGLDFEITHHPLTMRKVVHLIIAMERMKGSESTLSTEFRDENLLNFIMDSIVEEQIVFECASAPPAQITRTEVEPQNITDGEKRSLVMVQNNMELHAVTLQGGADSRKGDYFFPEHVDLFAPCVTIGGRTVALGIRGQNLYLSCRKDGDSPTLHLETLEDNSLLNISSDSDMVRFLFYKQDTGVNISTLMSVAQPNWLHQHSRAKQQAGGNVPGDRQTLPLLQHLSCVSKQKLMEYLAGKGKLKPPNPKPYLREDWQVKNPVMSTQVVNGKENKTPADRLRYESTKSQNTQSAKHPAKGAFGIANNVNVKDKILTPPQKAAKHPKTAFCQKLREYSCNKIKQQIWRQLERYLVMSNEDKQCQDESWPYVIGVTSAAVAELAVKSKTCKKTDDKKGHISANAPPPQAGFKRTSAPVVAQTVPRAGRTISHTSQATLTKTPKFPVRVIPQTEGKKPTAAQEERIKKLQEWREAKGISYKRPPMPVKTAVRLTVAMHQPFWGPMNEEDKVHSLISAVDRSLADCIILLAKGCPLEQVKGVLSRLPAVSRKFAKYWICQARLMEQEGNMEVLPMFEEAVGVVLEPVDELRTVVFEILKRKEEIQANEREEDQIPTNEGTPESIDIPMTPQPVRALIYGERGDSSVVKYKITATPGGPPSQQKEPVRVNGQEVRFFTPVRRSVRIERSSLRYPASLQEHDLCVASYADLISEEDAERSEEQEGGETSPYADNTPMYVYRQNEALEDKVFVKLVYDEDV